MLKLAHKNRKFKLSQVKFRQLCEKARKMKLGLKTRLDVVDFVVNDRISTRLCGYNWVGMIYFRWKFDVIRGFCVL